MELARSQRYGAWFFLFLMAFFYAGRTWCFEDRSSWNQRPLSSEQGSGTTVVELTGDVDKKGIYYLPAGMTVRDILGVAGAETGDRLKTGEMDRRVTSGMSIRVNRERQEGTLIQIGGISNAVRFALDGPMDLNKATAGDLMLISGIGEKTAEAIVDARTVRGGFRDVEDLLNVRGWNGKKLETFRDRFYVGSYPLKDGGQKRR